MFHDLVGENEVFGLCIVRFCRRDYAHVVAVFGLEVGILLKDSVKC